MNLPLTILLVDDDETTNFYNELIIQKHFSEAKIVVMTNGQKALDYLEQNHPPTIILLDINMPVMDGFEFLRALTQQPISPFPILAMLTTSLNANDLKLANHFPQIDAFLSKPLKVEDLQRLLPQRDTKM